ncbi:MAG: class I SAM-dependent methyltransferase [Chloroflexota bacterium]|nr:class I SAM-dependent methyltransferase [Chloroflexota bacterium]
MSERTENPADDQANILAGQRDYYRARAPEYDEWILRRGRYDHGPEMNARWFEETEQVRDALIGLDIRGDVLELAAGTGHWTETLARTAASVLALDASPETLAVARERLGRAGLAEKVRFEIADLFEWVPDRTYDAVVFGFWLSHVPDDRLDTFLATVASALRPGGTVFWVDSLRQDSATAPDQPLPAEEEEVMTRRLNDGRTFQVIKRFRSGATYEAAFARQGIDLTVAETPTYFQHATGVRLA